tara:strand:- start:532 stop:705 length:174 start_codon:yes stop_codon:yes gene_type:complete
MKKILILFFLMSGCTYVNDNNKINISTLNFSNNMTIEEFKIKLEEYAINTPYPNIDK